MKKPMDPEERLAHDLLNGIVCIESCLKELEKQLRRIRKATKEYRQGIEEFANGDKT